MLERRMDLSPRPYLPPLEDVLGAVGTTIGRVAKRPRRRAVSKREIAEICASMRLLADDDLARGFIADRRRYCDACERAVCAAGFVQYERYALCNHCATEYEVATVRGVTSSIGRFVRDKNFGETGVYALESVWRD
ncbi:MAG TPA: hypothetical protein VK821_16275 [Dehalococcoidia bacterium]|nr:hypothetical protein [Dehalococcoidia bacterium]